jgi:hypothetical protein
VLLEGFGTGSETAAAWGQAMASMVGGVANWWMEERPMPRANLARHLTDLVWDGLGHAGASRPRRPGSGDPERGA